VGGGIGSLARLYFSKIFNPIFLTIPLGTFLSNFFSCFILGLFFDFSSRNASINYLLIIGFCGGFCTFLTFTKENLEFIQKGNYYYFIFYTLLSLLICLLAIVSGIKLAKLFA